MDDNGHCLNPCIVVVTFNREHALSRLLDALSKAHYPQSTNIPLVISVDGGGSEKVLNYAEEFSWPFGEKMVITHSNNLGLKAHVMACGDLCSTYESIIMLEDDLVVSPEFYNYAQNGLRFYKNEKKVAGLSLYSFRFNENYYVPFEAIHTGGENYFMQVPSSWGQAWTRGQWTGFKKYVVENRHSNLEDRLPDNVKHWPDSSWKKHFYSYMVSHDLYMVYPYFSYSTNFGDKGENMKYSLSHFQVPLTLRAGNKAFQFNRLDDSALCYDAFFEVSHLWMEQHTDFHKLGKLTVDIYGSKPLASIETPYLLSTKLCTNALQTFDLNMRPFLNNVIFNNSGSGISFGKTEDFIEETLAKQKLLEAMESNT